jgi:hypothetical protein
LSRRVPTPAPRSTGWERPRVRRRSPALVCGPPPAEPRPTPEEASDPGGAPRRGSHGTEPTPGARERPLSARHTRDTDAPTQCHPGNSYRPFVVVFAPSCRKGCRRTLRYTRRATPHNCQIVESDRGSDAWRIPERQPALRRDLLRGRPRGRTTPPAESAGDDEHPRAEKTAVPGARAASKTRPDVPPVHARPQAVRPSGESPPLAECDARPARPGAKDFPVVPPELNVVVRRPTDERPAKHRGRRPEGAVERRDEP